VSPGINAVYQYFNELFLALVSPFITCTPFKKDTRFHKQGAPKDTNSKTKLKGIASLSGCKYKSNFPHAQTQSEKNNFRF
jgi:hypothetical protein